MKVEGLEQKGSVLEALKKMERYFDQMSKNKGKLGYSSHYPMLDNFTSGIIPGKVYTIASYSNVGKSRFCYGYVNRFLNQGKKIIFFSLEVDKGLLFQHLCCNMYGVYRDNLSIDMVDVLDFQNLLIYDDIYNLDDIEIIIQSLKPDIVFIDFVQNIQTAGSEYERNATIARKIQESAIKNNVIIFSLSQLSNSVAQGVSKGNLDFIALKGAGEFVASSDVIFLLRMVDKQISLSIIKNKFGRKPDFEIFFDTDFGQSRFTICKNDLVDKER